MTDYELIKTILELEEKIEQLEKNQLPNILFIGLTIGCFLFFVGSIICCIICEKNNRY